MTEYYTRLPEWDLSDEQIHHLITYYNDMKHKLKQYVTSSGQNQSLWLLFVDNRTQVMKDIVDSFPFVHDCYFISNTGINRHIDDGRTCTMTWCLQGAGVEPTLFWDNQTTDIIAADCHYAKGEAVLLNTKRFHSSPYQNELRVFFQVELSQNISYENHRDILI